MRTHVLNIDCSACSFGPKRQWKILIIHHGSGCFTNCLVLSFCNPILLRIIRHSWLPLNPGSSVEIIILVGVKFFSIVCFENTNVSTYLILNKILKILKFTKRFIFSFQKINPSFTRTIINKNDIIKTTIHGRSSHRSTKI
jgi:hypothetical protein